MGLLHKTFMQKNNMVRFYYTWHACSTTITLSTIFMWKRLLFAVFLSLGFPRGVMVKALDCGIILSEF